MVKLGIKKLGSLVEYATSSRNDLCKKKKKLKLLKYISHPHLKWNKRNEKAGCLIPPTYANAFMWIGNMISLRNLLINCKQNWEIPIFTKLFLTIFWLSIIHTTQWMGSHRSILLAVAFSLRARSTLQKLLGLYENTAFNETYLKDLIQPSFANHWLPGMRNTTLGGQASQLHPPSAAWNAFWDSTLQERPCSCGNEELDPNDMLAFCNCILKDF